MQNLIAPAILFLYLLMALGLKGGFALAKSGMDASIASSLGAAYGSVSAVTFVTATQFLEANGLHLGGAHDGGNGRAAGHAGCRCSAAHGAVGKRVLHRGACRVAVCSARGQPFVVLWPLPGCDLSAEPLVWYTDLHLCSDDGTRLTALRPRALARPLAARRQTRPATRRHITVGCPSSLA